MTVTTDLEVEVSIGALHAAVRAVLPHADKPKLGENPATGLARVRIVATATELHLIATNGRTSALAAIPIVEGTDSRQIRFSADDGVYVADIHPKNLRLLRDGVTPARIDGELHGEARLTFAGVGTDGTPGRLTAADSGGLWDGAETTRPLLPPADAYPDVAGLLSKALGAAEAPSSRSSRTVSTSPCSPPPARRTTRPCRSSPSGRRTSGGGSSCAALTSQGPCPADTTTTTR